MRKKRGGGGGGDNKEVNRHCCADIYRSRVAMKVCSLLIECAGRVE